MPHRAPVWMSEVIRKVLLSRMSDRMDGVAIMISKAAIRPGLSLRSSSTCEMTATMLDDKLGADLLLLVGREGVDDAVDRAGRAGGVQRGEDQVAGLGRRDGGLHRLEVAHFADQDHVRVLAQAAAQRLGEGRHVDADLALGDRRSSCARGSTRSGPRS